jgi:hypothetical protein
MTLYDVAAHARENVDANFRRVLEQKHHSIGQRKYRLKNGSLADVESARSSSTIGKPVSRGFRREFKE